MRPDSHNLVDTHRIEGEWKVQLTMATNFFSSKNSEEIRTINTKKF